MMKLYGKSFLFIVGMIMITVDEIEKAMEEAVKAVDQQSDKVKQRVTKKNTK